MKINGGNCVGIYVTGFKKQSLAEEAGVRIGDRLLQVREFVNLMNRLAYPGTATLRKPVQNLFTSDYNSNKNEYLSLTSSRGENNIYSLQ